MAHRSSRHRIRPIAALALEAGTTIGPRCANVHLGPEDQRLHKQAGYTTAPDSVETLWRHLARHPGGVHILAGGLSEHISAREGSFGRSGLLTGNIND